MYFYKELIEILKGRPLIKSHPKGKGVKDFVTTFAKK